MSTGEVGVTVPGTMTNPLIAKLFSAALALPGVQDNGHLSTYAESTVSAVQAARCDGEWATVDFCKPVWFESPEKLAALLVMTGYFESRLLERIAQGKCRAYECDAYRTRDGRLVHRARGVYQIQYTGFVEPDEWREMLGTGSWAFFTSSQVAARLMGAGMSRCKNVEGAIAAYATGGRCTWKGTTARMRVYEMVLVKLETRVAR